MNFDQVTHTGMTPPEEMREGRKLHFSSSEREIIKLYSEYIVTLNNDLINCLKDCNQIRMVLEHFL